MKIIDFGVARCTDSDLAVTTLQTDVGQLIGTLQYMSPEQCEGDPHDIDTRSDVYALGVVFYQLLCGKLPYDVTRMAMHQATRAIREQHPTKLSTLDRTLRGDVEIIALKALEKERERRYQSAADFGHDIHRYLTGEAITARRASIVYQLRLFARRNKAVFASLAAVFIVLVAGIIVSTSLYVRAEHARVEQTRERQRAEQEAQTSQQVTEFLVKLFEVSDPSQSRGNSITAREILDKGAARITTELKARPLVQATLMDTMGRVYESLGLFDAATPLLETALRTRRDNLGAEHPAVAETLHHLGVLVFHKGSWDAGEQVIREALAMRRKLLGNEHCDLAESLHWVAGLAWNRGDFEENERLAREQLTIRRKCLPEGAPPDENLARAMTNLANALRAKGNLDEAERLHREALAALRTVVGDDHPDVAESLRGLGFTLYEKGDLDEAERVHQEALVIDRRLYGNENYTVAFDLSALSDIAMAKRDDATAELLLRESLTIQRKVVPDGDLVTAAYLRDIALVLVRGNRPAESEAPARECLAMVRRKVREGSFRIAEAESILGACLTALQRYEEAEPLLLGAYPALAEKARTASSLYRTKMMQKRAAEALQRIVDLYNSWDAAEPGKGHAEKAAEWRGKLNDLEQTTTKP